MNELEFSPTVICIIAGCSSLEFSKIVFVYTYIYRRYEVLFPAFDNNIHAVQSVRNSPVWLGLLLAQDVF